MKLNLFIACFLPLTFARGQSTLASAPKSSFKVLDEAVLFKALNPENGTLLSPLLIPRTPGSQGSLTVQNFIVDHFTRLGWHAATDKFNADTPVGLMNMANIVIRKSEHSKPAKLTLAAHYDSKVEPAGFLGATDSAVPCALLLYVAEALANYNIDMDFIFFDGEEAIQRWTDDDSLYGARFHAANRTLPNTLVLLDLIGSANNVVPSWFAATDDLFKQIEKLNKSLRKKGLVSRMHVGGNTHHFGGSFLDDHIPFLKRGVPILHLMPFTFPPQWHTIDDDAEHLDWDSIHDWGVLLLSWLLKHRIADAKPEL